MAKVTVSNDKLSSIIYPANIMTGEEISVAISPTEILRLGRVNDRRSSFSRKFSTVWNLNFNGAMTNITSYVYI